MLYTVIKTKIFFALEYLKKKNKNFFVLVYKVVYNLDINYSKKILLLWHLILFELTVICLLLCHV